MFLAGVALAVAAAEPTLPNLSPEDRALLEHLELLLELELLETWDPEENLPIPLSESEPPADAPQPDERR